MQVGLEDSKPGGCSEKQQRKAAGPYWISEVGLEDRLGTGSVQPGSGPGEPNRFWVYI